MTLAILHTPETRGLDNSDVKLTSRAAEVVFGNEKLKRKSFLPVVRSRKAA